ncbi:MAG: alpha-amylase family glycosyl hydrolase [bacterium]|nr:alpha-amylase family glycosyl hydrolase [bacterium]
MVTAHTVKRFTVLLFAVIIESIVLTTAPGGAAADFVSSDRPYLQPFPVVTATAGGQAELNLAPYTIRKNADSPVRYQVLSPPDCQAHIDIGTVIVKPADTVSGLREITVIAREIPEKPISASLVVLVLPGKTGVPVRVPANSIAATPNATVSMAGSFNSWDAAASPLTYDPATGEFATVLPLPPGSYPYKLVVDGRWIPDPSNPVSVDDGFDGKNSLIEAGTAGGKLIVLPLESRWRRHDDSWEYQASLLVIHEDRSPHKAVDNAILPEKKSPWIRVYGGGRFLPSSCVTTTTLTDSRWRVEIMYGSQDKKEVPFNLVAALPPGLPYTNYRWRDTPDALDRGSRVLYFAMTDRFRDGNRENNNPVIDPELAWIANFQGGDFSGLQQSIEDGYFNRLGVEWLWISPVAAGPDRAFRDSLPPHRKFSGYHGYWPVDLSRPEPRFGTMIELKTLVTTAHRHGLKVMFDAVFNHVHEKSLLLEQVPNWFVPITLPDGSQNIRRFDSHPLTTWFDVFLPSFDYYPNKEARSFMIENALWWIEQTGVDGFRLDAVKHIPRIFWEDLRIALKDRYPGFLMIGETISGRNEINRFLGTDCLDGQFDFPLYFALRNVLALNRGSMADLESAVRLSETIFPSGNAMSPLLGNHDFARFTAYADGDIHADEDEKETGWRQPPRVDKQETYERLQAAFGLIMSLPGYPLIYYGDEYGMSGAGDPDNRRPMRFDGRRSRLEQETAEFVSKLCHLRKTHPALTSEGRLPIMASENVLVFARYSFGDRLIVALNRGEQTRYLNLPAPPGFPVNKCYRDLITDRRDRAGKNQISITLPPRSVSILSPE